ncbi:hypothetical protein E3Q10_02098 [Wallemia mellicola]|uniref:PROP1-like PPR domain-containing protein n=1 Tax=Wallemia mellicola TaxID=1708541 RepID=A0A4T0RJ61_9BASI|nr:hypothetical protein E3Q17_02060 [Wallemia mellicola]TIC11532.1 hypothetical protein E3Q14_02269 [Wallemia mellicola]TIC17306.1 hypothetical protein E3Q13_02534 [Wallemia mellicola]TIC30519.1 hypothetical protein E3Q10_02098 [Wallemia mellicola]TIC35217.1 hypothetical protein E3Q09_02449 [Wallemia mellicola]
MNHLQRQTKDLTKLLKLKDKQLLSNSKFIDNLSHDDIALLYKQLMLSNDSSRKILDKSTDRTINNKLIKIRSLLVDQLSKESSKSQLLDTNLASKLRNIWLKKKSSTINYNNNLNNTLNNYNILNEINDLKRQSNNIQLSHNQRSILLNRFQEAIVASKSDNKVIAPNLQVATRDEWETLISSAANDLDLTHLSKSIELLDQSNALNIDLFNNILSILAKKGQISSINHIFRSFGHLITPNNETYATFVDAHTFNQDLTNAWNLLSSFENRGIILPQATYTNLIRSHLSSNQPSYLKQRGWNLFVHSRLMAHPIPSISLYSTMISSCAQTNQPEIERALDLYNELKNYGLFIDQNIYASLIHTLAKAHKKGTSSEIDRLFIEMLDSGLKPTRNIFSALMELSKRTGDVKRARHVLANWISSDQSISDQDLSRFFYAYSSTQPIKYLNRYSYNHETNNTSLNATDLSNVNDDASQQFTPESLPKTSSEIISESDMIFNRILHDKDIDLFILGSDISNSTTESTSDQFDKPFKDVTITNRLLNAFISIRINHSNTPDQIIKFTCKLFDSLNLSKNGYTIAMLMEHIYLNHNTLSHLAEALFQEYNQFLDKSTKDIEQDSTLKLQSDYPLESILSNKRKLEVDAGIDETVISKIWTTYINILALSGRLSKAVKVLSDFVKLFPPSSLVKNFALQSQLKSQPTSIKISKEIKPDLQPHLSFHKLRVLHDRLVNLVKIDQEAGNTTKLYNYNSAKQALGFLTWSIKAYEGAYRYHNRNALNTMDNMGVHHSKTISKINEKEVEQIRIVN